MNPEQLAREYVDPICGEIFKDGFRAGAQSKDEEIRELREALENISDNCDDHVIVAREALKQESEE